MTRLKVRLAIAVTTAIASTFVLTEASARSRRHHIVIHQAGCFNTLPSYGYDGCGLREFSHGPGSCWRRVEGYTRNGPVARRVYICR